MIDALVATRPAGCPSDTRLTEYGANELEPRDRERVASHLAGCARCSLRRDELARLDEAFLATPESRALHERLLAVARARPRWPARVLVGLGAAAALALVLAPRESGDERTKGGGRLGFYVKHGATVRAGRADEQLEPGDLVRFTYASARATSLAVFGFDALGKVSVYVPFDEVEPGQNVALASAVALDDTLGEERFIAIFCDRPPSTDEARARIVAARGALNRLPGCTIDTLKVTKVAPR